MAAVLIVCFAEALLAPYPALTALPPYLFVILLVPHLAPVHPALVVTFPSSPFYASFFLPDFVFSVTRARHCVEPLQYLRRRVCRLLRVRLGVPANAMRMRGLL